jgi:hypothetical protein
LPGMMRRIPGVKSLQYEHTINQLKQLRVSEPPHRPTRETQALICDTIRWPVGHPAFPWIGIEGPQLFWKSMLTLSELSCDLQISKIQVSPPGSACSCSKQFTKQFDICIERSGNTEVPTLAISYRDTSSAQDMSIHANP